MSHRLRFASIAVLCAAVLTVPALAHDDDEEAGKVPSELEFYKEAGLEPGMVLPGGTNLADFAESAREPGPKGNETPGQVRSDIQDLQEQKMMNDFLNPKESALVDKQLKVARLRLAIAERRAARDQLRKQKKTREAAKLEREIHLLKRKMTEVSPAASKGTMADMLRARDTSDE